MVSTASLYHYFWCYTFDKAMKYSRAGFTLIELLVVIAIVGLLAAMVFAALGSAKSNGTDTAIKSEFDQIRTQMELSQTSGSDYGPIYPMAVCPTSSNPPDSIFYTDPTVKKIIAHVGDSNGGQTICASGDPSGNGRATSWAIESPVKYTTQWWCVSSNNGPKLSIREENIFAYLFHLVVPDTYAMIGPSGPFIGGGSLAASCP
jgi:prepilin-type N-terminal cleavage/methylation domain-containing protein